MARRKTPMETFSFRAPRDVIEAGRRTAKKRNEYLGDALRDFVTRYARDEIRAARTAKPDTEETPAMTADREQLDPATAASLARGLDQSAAGQTVDLGDFTQYATDPEETQP